MNAMGHYRDNLVNKKDLERRALAVDFATDEERKDFVELLGSPSGRRVLWNLLAYCRIYEDSFTGNSATFHNEGRRSVGLHILGKVITAKPDAYLEMMKEAKLREEKNG